MLRVSHTGSSTQTVITIEGCLVEEYVPLVYDDCIERLTDNRTLVLFLKDVTEVDNNGFELLRQLIVRGVQIRAAGIYNQHRVDELKRQCERAEAPGLETVMNGTV